MILGGEAFSNNQNIQKVIMHNNVQAIDSYAFYNCTNLIEADLPEGLLALEEHVFTRSGIKKIVLPKSINELYLFENPSTGLTYYVYPEMSDGVGSVNYRVIVELSDLQNNILFDSWMCDNITESTVLKTTKILEGQEYQRVSKQLEEFEMYDINLYDENNQVLAADDQFILSMPLVQESDDYNVYYFENNQLHLVDSFIDNGYIKIKTNKTGKYIVSNSEIKTLLGDVNKDGSITYGDAVLILQADSNIQPLTESQKEVADINGDNTINYNDAVQILRMDAGLITDFN